MRKVHFAKMDVFPLISKPYSSFENYRKKKATGLFYFLFPRLSKIGTSKI